MKAPNFGTSTLLVVLVLSLLRFLYLRNTGVARQHHLRSTVEDVWQLSHRKLIDTGRDEPNEAAPMDEGEESNATASQKAPPQTTVSGQKSKPVIGVASHAVAPVVLDYPIEPEPGGSPLCCEEVSLSGNPHFSGEYQRLHDNPAMKRQVQAASGTHVKGVYSLSVTRGSRKISAYGSGGWVRGCPQQIHHWMIFQQGLWEETTSMRIYCTNEEYQGAVEDDAEQQVLASETDLVTDVQTEVVRLFEAAGKPPMFWLHVDSSSEQAL